MSLDGFNKTHCDKCNEKVERGEGIYADRGFYHKDPCYKQIKQKYIDDYEWDEHKTSYEIEMVCPHCGYVERDSWEPVSYTHLRAHETRHDLVCRLLLEKKKKKNELDFIVTYQDNK